MDALSSRIAFSIAETLKKSIVDRGFANLVVSGGSSPLEIFNCLSQIQIAWHQVNIILGDDRLVDTASIDSNERLVRNSLMINFAKVANYVSLVEISELPLDLNNLFDVVLLGMGLDGHFASLFPELLGDKSLFDVSTKKYLYTSDISLGDPAYRRITMNMSMLINTRRCILLVTSNSKRKVLEQAQTNTELPIHYLVNQTAVDIEYSDIDF